MVGSGVVVAVVPVEIAIAGKRLTLIAIAKGCHVYMAPLFLGLFADRKKLTISSIS